MHDPDTLVALILEMSPGFQGGHSTTGKKVAEVLAVPFLLHMTDLSRKARSLGLKPNDLWPWLRRRKDV